MRSIFQVMTVIFVFSLSLLSKADDSILDYSKPTLLYGKDSFTFIKGESEEEIIRNAHNYKLQQLEILSSLKGFTAIQLERVQRNLLNGGLSIDISESKVLLLPAALDFEKVLSSTHFDKRIDAINPGLAPAGANYSEKALLKYIRELRNQITEYKYIAESCVNN